MTVPNNLRMVMMKTLSIYAAAVLALSMQGFSQETVKPTAKHTPPKKITVTTPAAETANGGPSVPVVEAFLKRMFGYNENLVFKVSSVKPTDAQGISEVTAVVNTPQGQQVLRFFVTADSQHAIMGEMMPFGTDPFMKIRDQLKKEAFGAAKGPADSPLLIVEFADLECPACKAALPAMERLQQDFPSARFVFQSFPLEQLHPWAAMGAKYLDCISRQSDEAAWKFIESVYAHQGEITAANAKEMLDKYTGFADQDVAKISACAANAETAARIAKSVALAQKISVTSTPTLFVNGRGIAGVNPQDYDALKSIVQFELEQAKLGK